MINPFLWRKYIDYSTIDEIRSLKTKIDATFKKDDIKRGYGGIREIEFFIQSMQLIYGGKEPMLKQRRTLIALHMLNQKDLIGEDERIKAHLGVDYFVNRLHPDARKLTAVAAHVVVLFFAGAILLLGGTRVVSDSLALEQTTPALGWKMGYVYLALPISGFFVVLYTVENLLETVRGRPAGRPLFYGAS